MANNRPLRAAMEKLALKRRLPVLIAQPKHTGDNAGMIAFAAWAAPAATASVDFAALGVGTTVIQI